MINLLMLSALWTFFWESSSSKMKKIWEDLSFYQKWLIIEGVKIIFFIFLLYSIGSWSLELNLLSTILIALYIISCFLSIYFAMNAINIADRSTNSLFSVLVLPMLLFADILLWYEITTYHIIGVIFIVLILFFSSYNWSISTKWIYYVLWTQITAAFGITIYKYLITHYVSVEAIILVVSIFMVITFSIITIYNLWIKWLTVCFKYNNLQIWFLTSIWQTLWLFAYLFWPASIVTAIRRIFQMFWWVVFGKLLFHEENFWKKIWNLAVLSIGILIMNFQSFTVNANFLTDINLSLFKWDISWYKVHTEQIIDIENFSKNIENSYINHIN